MLQRSLATNDLAVQALVKGPNAASDINLARAYMNAGFSLVLIAETYCQGDILVGPPLTPAQMLDSAIARFKQASVDRRRRGGGGCRRGNEGVECVERRTGARVAPEERLRRREHVAALVPAAFVYNAITVDDASNRALGNNTYALRFVATRSSSRRYRALNDPRVPWKDALQEGARHGARVVSPQ